jgi:hypothetical protein
MLTQIDSSVLHITLMRTTMLDTEAAISQCGAYRNYPAERGRLPFNREELMYIEPPQRQRRCNPLALIGGHNTVDNICSFALPQD